MESDPKFDKPPVHVSSAGVSSVNPDDILNSRAGREEVAKAARVLARHVRPAAATDGDAKLRRVRERIARIAGGYVAIGPGGAFREGVRAGIEEAVRDALHVIDQALEGEP